jgi:Na+-translocating ferredoxin:NAD+ oxidoreductase RnfG subunit
MDKINIIRKNCSSIFFIAMVVILAISLFISCARSYVLLQQDEQTLEILRNIFTEASYYTYDESSEIYGIYDTEKQQIGYAFYANGMGQAVYGGEMGNKVPGPIVILVGLEDKETIKGIYVVSNSETSQYWNKLIERNYFTQFNELKIEDAYFVRSGGKIDVVTVLL